MKEEEGKGVDILPLKPLLLKCEAEGIESGDEISGVELER
jgi:hypothetical protein